MSVQQLLREQLAQQNPEFRKLLDEHQSRERRLDELSDKGWLTGEEELEQKRLKKEKLMLKDRMEAHLRAHTA